MLDCVDVGIDVSGHDHATGRINDLALTAHSVEMISIKASRFTDTQDLVMIDQNGMLLEYSSSGVQGENGLNIANQ